MFSLFDSLLGNKGAWCITFQNNKNKVEKSVIFPIFSHLKNKFAKNKILPNRTRPTLVLTLSTNNLGK